MEPTPNQVAAVGCPTCGAAPGEKCELSTGQPRFEPHQARRVNASDEENGTLPKTEYAQQKERKLQKLLARLQGSTNGNGNNGKKKGLKRPSSRQDD